MRQGWAVMQDDTVLCADCVDEIAVHGGRQQRADEVVHAWIACSPGVCCRWCGASAALADDDGGEG